MRLTTTSGAADRRICPSSSPCGCQCLRAQGVTDLALGVLPGNVGALRLYERRGYRPTWMYMSRFGSG